MYKVVLIDDEDIIVEGMRRMVKWADYGCGVIGTAYDAASGSALIRQLHPDIVFTDIKMPGPDGLTMLAGLRSEFPDTQITVLTGYRDFSYAQQSIRLGVTRFLLKPSKMDELHEALAAMTAKLRQQTGTPEPEAPAQPEEASEPPAKQAGSFLVKQALAFLEQQYARKLTLQEVADECYVSQWHLSKLLNKHTGKNFYDLLNTIRIQKAKELLADPSLKIGDIAELVGYSDNGHFARTFKKLEGVSANEYRNRLQ